MFRLFILSTIISATVYGSTCERSPLCDELNDLSFACSETLSEDSCDKFVAVFDKSVQPGSCVPLETCALKQGNPSSLIHFKLLASLPYGSALKLFTSEKLRKTMTGHAGEAFRKQSKMDQTKLGKTLFPSKIIPECRNFESLNFKAVKKDIIEKSKVIAAQYEYSEAEADGFVIWDGDVEKKIVSLKTKKECTVKGIGLIDKISKVSGHQILRYQTNATGSGYHDEAFVDMKTCSKFWELKNGKVSTSKLQTSSWKKCTTCWNKNYKGCLRIVPGHEGLEF